MTIDKDGQRALMDLADGAAKMIWAHGLKNRTLTITIFPTGAQVSCYDVETGIYDFYHDKIGRGKWEDRTESRNRLFAADREGNAIPAFEDDLK